MKNFEINFDGLVGPTHNYAGLSYGNVASVSSANLQSNPKQAALQGLAKMKALADMGLKQGVLPPQERPDVYTLRRLGFSGSDARVLEQAAQQAPAIHLACCSASSMWTANAATVSPSADTADGKVHFTPANLTNKFHRSLEPEVTGRILQSTFAESKHFAHHRHLPNNEYFGDEGAANHTRLCADYGRAGVELFVFGRCALDQTRTAPRKFPARQTLQACQAIARLHGVSEDNLIYVQQNPEVIDAGVFHNDVISVGNQNVLLYHEQAFVDSDGVMAEIRQKFTGDDVHLLKVPTASVSVADAVQTYLFNTQIVTLADQTMAIIAPVECRENDAVQRFLAELPKMGSPIKQVHYFDVKQSMQNGGGPACLRLRVALTEQELNAVNPHVFITDSLYSALTAWIHKHYRDRLTVPDLQDASLLRESRTALDELTQILRLGSVYPFQRV